MKRQHFVLVGLAIILGLSCVPRADAQLFQRWFGPKTNEKTPPAPKTTPTDPRRVAEINVEIAWLADPITFPYYLEARVNGSKLEVRGYVPNKSVREHALRIAQVYSSLPVTDSMREHSSVQVKSSQMSPQQLQRSAVSSLRVALPKHYQQLKVECGADGKVFVLGTVATHDDKMAVSSALRRLHGCTSVQNFTVIPNELAQESPRDKTPFVKTSNPGDAKNKPVVVQDNKSKPWLNWPWVKSKEGTTTEEPPVLDAYKGIGTIQPKQPGGPGLFPVLPGPKTTPANKTPAPETVDPPVSKTPLTAAELQRRIRAASPQITNAEVQFVGNQQVRITLEVRSERDVATAAERVFAIPELQNYRPELQFRIASP